MNLNVNPVTNFYNHDHHYRLVAIKKVSKQVVAGLLYHVEGIFVNQSGDKFATYITVLYRPWIEPQYEITVKTQKAFYYKL